MEKAEGVALDASLPPAKLLNTTRSPATCSLREWAKDLGHDEAHKLLSEILDQEKATNNKLTNLAVTHVSRTFYRAKAA